MDDRKTIVAILAHPDDESFGMGGTLALYASRGADVYLVCATRGEVGTVDPEHMQGYHSIAALREDELRCAAQHLGLRDVFFLGYRDSGMPGSPENKHPDAQVNHSLEEIAARVVRYIRELKPDIVITFDPIGGYRHPDHIQIHNATVLAFDKAADPSFHPEMGSPFQPRALYFHTISRNMFRFGARFLRLFGRDPRRWGRNRDIDLVSLGDEMEFPVHARIYYGPVAARKDEAGNCHASQGGSPMRRGLIGLFMGGYSRTETFMRAYPPPVANMRVQSDLFDLIE
ncbi:MAG: PIG-L deacetylase family protein [Bacteroidota bacterium]